MSNKSTTVLPDPEEFEALQKLLAETTSFIPTLQSEFIPAINQVVKEYLSGFHLLTEIIQSPDFFSSITSAQEAARSTFEYFSQNYRLIGSSLQQICNDDNSNRVSESLAKTLSSALNYMTPEQKKAITDVFPEAIQGSSTSLPAEKTISKKWSVQNLAAVLSLLLALIFGILDQMPDEQIDLLMEQNEVIIQQNEKIIENQSEEISVLRSLLQSAQDINDVLDDLTQEGNDLHISLDSSTKTQDGILDILDHRYDSENIDGQSQDNNGLEKADDAQYLQ